LKEASAKKIESAHEAHETKASVVTSGHLEAAHPPVVDEKKSSHKIEPVVE